MAITLLDLPSATPSKTWSLNPWKTRLLLNFKGLDYETEWVEYPHIKARVSPHVPPNETGTAYTIPTVILDGTWIMDSRKIATAVEERHPSPSVHLDSPLLPRVEETVRVAISPLMAIFFTRIPSNVLNPISAEYWYRTRAERVGMPLFENEKLNGGEKAYAAAEAGWQAMTALLKENKGPFFMGETVSYADFVWAGALLFVKRAEAQVFSEMLARSGDASAHEGLLSACEPWWRRDDR